MRRLGASTGTSASAGLSWPCGRRNVWPVPVADADRRDPAVVADRHPLVVRQQRVVGAELLADRRSRGGCWCRSRCSRRSRTAGPSRRSTAARARRGTLASCALPWRNPSEIAWRSARRGSERELHQPVHLVGVDQLGAAQVEDLVADRDADPPVHVVGTPEASERQVLDREVGRRIVGRVEPAAQQRVVGRVEGGVHRLLGSKCFFRPCQQR